MDVAWSAPQEAHYHVEAINLPSRSLVYSELRLHQLNPRLYALTFCSKCETPMALVFLLVAAFTRGGLSRHE